MKGQDLTLQITKDLTVDSLVEDITEMIHKHFDLYANQCASERELLPITYEQDIIKACRVYARKQFRQLSLEILTSESRQSTMAIHRVCKETFKMVSEFIYSYIAQVDGEY